MLDVPALMTELAKARRIFHSEADFQHALAWLIQQTYPDAKIRLERPFPGLKDKRSRLDVWVRIGDAVDAIELKYQTRKLNIEVDGERFELTNKGAEDNLGYDFLTDVARVEWLTETIPNCTGHAILLSNEAVWNPSKSVGEFNKDAFRIHHGRAITGTLAWKKSYHASNPRASALKLGGEYITAWQDYSEVEGTYGQFRYLWLCAVPKVPETAA